MDALWIASAISNRDIPVASIPMSIHGSSSMELRGIELARSAIGVIVTERSAHVGECVGTKAHETCSFLARSLLHQRHVRAHHGIKRLRIAPLSGIASEPPEPPPHAVAMSVSAIAAAVDAMLRKCESAARISLGAAWQTII